MPLHQEKKLQHELMEVLNELRVALPGVQMLFAFLLTIPFSQRFERVTPLQKWLFLADVLCTTISSLFLIAPSVYHRLHFRADVADKDSMLQIFNRLAILGSIFLALAIASSIFLIADFIFGHATAIFATAVIAAVCAALWYGLPLKRRSRGH